MLTKPNKHQAAYLAAVAQAIAVGYFSWAGLPALEKVAKGAGLPQSMMDLVVAVLVYALLTIAGFVALDERVCRMETDHEQ